MTATHRELGWFGALFGRFGKLFAAGDWHEGYSCLVQKTHRTEGGGKVQGSLGPRFVAGLSPPVPNILELKAFGDSGNFT